MNYAETIMKGMNIIKPRILTSRLKLTALFGLIGLLLVGIGTSGAPVAAQSGSANFEKISCQTFDLAKYAPGAVEGQDVECGYLTVPERHAQPDGPKIKLGIAIIKRTGANSTPASPLVLTQGGPGGSSIELFLALAAPTNKLGQMLRADRDLIIFEQRGTRYSQPFLFCNELLDLTIKTADQNLSDAEDLKLTRQAVEACRSRLVGQGIDLAAYNSLENADDVASLAQALGYDQLNFYGVSYGTMLAQHVMRQHPEILRTVILDGIVPLQINPNEQAPVTENRSYTQLFEACAANTDCNHYYPDLQTVFFNTVTALNQKPVQLPLTDNTTGKSYQTLFDGDSLIGFTTQLLYITDAIPTLPKMFYQAQAGQFTVPQAVGGELVFDHSTAQGMYFSVMCAEDFDFKLNNLDLTGVRPALAKLDKFGTEESLQICADWNVPQLVPAADNPVTSDIPALLFSGKFDPVAPPTYGDTMAKTLSHAYNYVFPSNGHGAFMVGECSTKIMRAFLNDPATAPNASCLDDRPTPDFLSPANMLMSPGATFPLNLSIKVLENFDNPAKVTASLTPLIWPTIALLGLLIFPPVWLLGWLVNRIRRAPREKRGLARLGPWLGVLLALLAIVFVVLQGYMLDVTLSGNVFKIVGVSRSFTWIFVLPWLIGLTAIGMAVLAGLAWAKGYWGRLARYYYGLTALLGLAYVIFLASIGQMSVLYQ